MKDHKPKIDIDPELLDEAVKAVHDPQKTEKSIDVKDATDPSPEPTSEEAGEDFKDRWIRVAADFDNFRKRTLKEKADLIKYGNENLIRELLPVMDNFERALSVSSNLSSGESSVIQGVGMIFNQLKTTLERFGLTSDTAVGKTFDPHLHEAMSHHDTTDVPANTVVEEHHRMYFLHKKLIRPALVTVSRNPVEAEAPTVEMSPDSENS